MKTEQLLQLDCRDDENKKTIQRVLRKIGPLASFAEDGDIPLESIARAIQVMDVKYHVGIKHITSDTHSNRKYTIWCATLESHQTFAQLGRVYGATMYEVMAKSAIRLFDEVRKIKRTGKEDA